MGAKPHFRVLGVPVRIEPLFWLAAVFLAYRLGDARLIITWVAVVLVSVLVHELGHAMALRVFGQSSSIVLHGFGGLTFSQRRLGRVQSIVVSLAGPLTALVLLGLPALALRDSDIGQELAFDYFRSDNSFGLWPVVFFAAYVNIWWSIANLLPIRPLDGGNVLTEIVGIQPARIVSVVVGGAAAIWAYNHSTDFQFAAFFAGFLAFINFSEYRRARQGARAPSAFDVEGPPVPGGGGTAPGTPGGRAGGPAGGAAGRRRGGWPSGPPTRSTDSRRNQPPMAPATNTPGAIDGPTAESFVWNLLRRGDVAGARRVLARATTPVSAFAAASVQAAAGGPLDPLADAYLAVPSGPSNLVPASVAADHPDFEVFVRRLIGQGAPGVEAAISIQTHLHYAERFAASAQVGEVVHDVAPAGRAQVAFDVACAWSRAGELDRALRWLDRAIGAGFAAPRLLDGEPDLAPVRALPGWTAVRARL